MNSCHSCTTIPKRDQIISCDNCQNSYCLKCIKAHLNDPAIQKTFIICNFDTIRFKKQAKSWLCFSCQKLCMCRGCKGMSLGTIEKQLLGKKEPTVLKTKIQDFQRYFEEIELFKNMNFYQLTPFEQEYFMNKAMLYCRQNELDFSGKKPYDQSPLKSVPQQTPINKKIIQIDSDQNGQVQNQIEEEENHQEIQQNQQMQDNQQVQEKSQMIEPMAVEMESQMNGSELRRNFQAIDVEGNTGLQREGLVQDQRMNRQSQAGVPQGQLVVTSENQLQK